MTELEESRRAAEQVAHLAGERARAQFAKAHELVVEVKGAQDFVSVADKEAEQLIVRELSRQFPDHAFVGEESADKQTRGERPTWVIDPIDGTTNFLRGIPLWAVSIGLVIDGEPVVGVIRVPMLDETFSAIKGGGATLNGNRIRAASTTTMERALIALGSSHRAGVKPYYDAVAAVMDAGAETRRLGSACVQIAHVACGRLDAYLEHHLNAWDVAAGLCICREAGALANDFTRGDWLKDGNPFLVAAPGMFDRVKSLAGM